MSGINSNKLGMFNVSNKRSLFGTIMNNDEIINNEKTNKVETINKKNGQNGQMILISDLEGCAEYSPGGVKQSTVECQKPFFDSIKDFLESNPNNKVAFLGDYFDKGPFAFESITNIIELHQKYIKRVIIILGNRDINKLRIPYEIQELNIIYKNSDKYRWADWIKSGLYEKISKEKEVTEKINIILSTSMGAIPALRKKDKNENQTAYNKFVKQQTYNYFRHNKLLEKNLFTINNKTNGNSKIKEINFNENIIYLFKNSKIVHYDEDFEVLLSHAGGLAPELLEINIESFISNLKSLLINTENLDYYQKIELIRKDGLQIKNLSDIVNKNSKAKKTNNSYNRKYENLYENCSQNFLNSDLKNKFTKLIENINLLLTKFIEKNNFKFNKDTIPEEYFILQAMGLKSDNADYKFLSFIDSCDNTGCSGPSFDMNNEYYNYLKKLSKIGVKIIAHGHKPHCAPVPLIYKRNESDIVFIDNDVSNGYRPENINEVNKVPLSYISYNNTKLSVGVGFINSTNKNIKVPNKNSIPKLPPSIKNFSFMLNEWNISTICGLNKIPILDKKEVTYSKINYPGKEELFFKKGFNPTDTKLF